jgi:hypothetical protein
MRRAAVLIAVVLLGVACGGDDASDRREPDCTTTSGEPTSTLDPSCVVPAGETTTSTTDDAGGQRWSGTLATDEGGPGLEGGTEGTFELTVASDGTVTGAGSSRSSYSNAPPIDSVITVTGQREGDSFHLTLALDPGTAIDVEAEIEGDVAEGGFELAGAAGAFSTGTVHLECQDCG